MTTNQHSPERGRPEARADERAASAACPICNSETPHEHDARTVAAWRSVSKTHGKPFASYETRLRLWLVYGSDAAEALGIGATVEAAWWSAYRVGENALGHGQARAEQPAAPPAVAGGAEDKTQIRGTLEDRSPACEECGGLGYFDYGDEISGSQPEDCAACGGSGFARHPLPEDHSDAPNAADAKTETASAVVAVTKQRIVRGGWGPIEVEVDEIPANTKLYASPVVGAGPQWMPIESAPRDGTAVLALVDGDVPTFVHWLNYRGPRRRKTISGWAFTAVDDDGGWEWAQPTHWMPLPAPPAAAPAPAQTGKKKD